VEIFLNNEADGFEKISNKLSKGRVRIFYKGKSTKGTFITEEVEQQMIASLPYTPIKCEYNYSKEDFEGHTKYVHKEIIIGIVPENPNVSMETIEEDGIIREYYTSDVYIFTGIYPEIGEQVCGKQQSLEIDEKTFDGDWQIINNEILFVFSKAEFKALQVLGDERTPAYKSSLFYEELLYELNQDDKTKMEEEKMSIEKELAAANIKLAQYEADAIKNLAKIEVQEGKISQYETEVAELKASITDYEKIVAEYTTKITEYIVRETEYTDKITEYESKIADYDAKIAEYEVKITNYETKISERETIKTEYESMKAKLAEETTKYEAAKKEEVLESFYTILGKEAVDEFVKDKLDYSVEELDNSLCAYSFKNSKTSIFPKADLGETQDPIAQVLNKYKK
jgi:hypothetical protein